MLWDSALLTYFIYLLDLTRVLVFSLELCIGVVEGAGIPNCYPFGRFFASLALALASADYREIKEKGLGLFCVSHNLRRSSVGVRGQNTGDYRL